MRGVTLDQVTRSTATARFQLFLLETLELPASIHGHLLPALYQMLSAYTDGVHGVELFPIGAKDSWAYWLAPHREVGVIIPFLVYRTRFTMKMENGALIRGKSSPITLEVMVGEEYDAANLLQALFRKYSPEELTDIVQQFFSAIGWDDPYRNYSSATLDWLSAANTLCAGWRYGDTDER